MPSALIRPLTVVTGGIASRSGLRSERRGSRAAGRPYGACGRCARPSWRSGWRPGASARRRRLLSRSYTRLRLGRGCCGSGHLRQRVLLHAARVARGRLRALDAGLNGVTKIVGHGVPLGPPARRAERKRPRGCVAPHGLESFGRKPAVISRRIVARSGCPSPYHTKSDAISNLFLD